MISRDLYILGTAGLAQEVAWYAEAINASSAHAMWNVKGFVGAAHLPAGAPLGRYPYLGDDEWLLSQNGQADLVLAIGHPDIRDRVGRRFLDEGNRFAFPNLVHPRALVDASRVQTGVGNVFTPGCILTVDISIGNFSLFNWNVTVGHEVTIGDALVANPGCHISGGVKIADRVLLGAGAVILEGRTIECNSRVGAGAVVTHDVPQGSTVVGIPARVVGA